MHLVNYGQCTRPLNLSDGLALAELIKICNRHAITSSTDVFRGVEHADGDQLVGGEDRLTMGWDLEQGVVYSVVKFGDKIGDPQHNRTAWLFQNPLKLAPTIDQMRTRIARYFTEVIDREDTGFVALCPELGIASQGEI